MRLADEIVALGGGERGARLIALAVVDDAELVPGEGVGIVAADGDSEHSLGLLEIGRILGRDQGMAEQGGDQRLVVRAGDRLAQRRHRLDRMARFEQNLPAQLEEIGIVRRRRDQRRDLRIGLVGMAGAVIGISAGIMARDRAIGRRVAAHDLDRIVDIAGQFGPDSLEARLERRVGRPVPGRILAVALIENGDALAVERVGAGVAVFLRDVHPEFEVQQPLEESERAAAADPGAGEDRRSGLVRAIFLDSGEGEEAPHRRLLAGGDHAHAGLARAGRDRRRAEEERKDHDPGRLAGALVDPQDMAAGDVAELVRDHALNFIGIFGGGEQARMDVDDLAAGDEGVDLRIGEDHHLDVLGLEARGDDQRPRQFAEQRLGLGVAQDRLGGRRLDAGREADREQHQQPDQPGGRTVP